LTVVYVLMAVSAVSAFILAVRTMPDVSLGHELEGAIADAA
jgi:hypothetical protein